MKTKYTKQERNEIYKKALAILKNEIFEYHMGFICNAIKNAIDFNSCHKLDLNPFPEILKHKPEKMHITQNNTHVWFSVNDSGLTKRIEILQQAINETETIN